MYDMPNITGSGNLASATISPEKPTTPVRSATHRSFSSLQDLEDNLSELERRLADVRVGSPASEDDTAPEAVHSPLTTDLNVLAKRIGDCTVRVRVLLVELEV